MKFSAENAGHPLVLNAGQAPAENIGPRARPTYWTLSDLSTAGSVVSSAIGVPSVLVPLESRANDACSRVALVAAAVASAAALAAAVVFASKFCCAAAWACCAAAAASMFACVG